MPILVMRAFRSTLLGQSYDGALARQIHYAAERGVPWGVSESAYNVRDRHHTYQYRAFGVPGLALKRGLGRELVIAPYASALAVMIDPERAIANLRTLEALGAHGGFGFYDALDYTRPPQDQPFTIVRNHMSHHVGMTLVAFTNALLDRRWQERFHDDPMVRAAALLLDERVPNRLEYQAPQPVHAEEVHEDTTLTGPVVREYDTVSTPRPQVALLGHAPLTVMVTHAGGGYSRYEDLAVTRWNPDGTCDDTGQFCYVRDLQTGHTWSTGHHPTTAIADSYRAYLATDRVTLVRRDGPLETRTEIVVVPEDSAEVRRVTVTNNSNGERAVELTSYGEIVLAPRSADRAHPAFSKLFVETEWHEWCQAITATRRARSADEPALWCVHVIDTGRRRVGPVTYETDRDRFLGRGRTARDPAALAGGAALSGTTGAVLDPVFALRTRVLLGPGQSASVAFTTLVAKSRERAFELADRYHGPHAAQRALDLAWTSTQIELRELGISPADAAACQDLAGYILFPVGIKPVPRAGAGADGRHGWLQTLWAHAISGDWPVVVASIDSTDGIPSLQQLLTAHRYWRLRGVMVDLVVVTDEPQGYVESLRDRTTELVLSTGGPAVLDTPGGVHIRNLGALGPADLDTITAVARLTVACDGRTLGRIVADLARVPEALPGTAPGVARPSAADAARDTAAPLPSASGAGPALAPGMHSPPVPGPDTESATPLRFDNGIGGLTAGNRYRIRVHGHHVPPAPWANVIANEKGGFVITERGGGFTWAASSYFFRLTPWSNDPVADPVGEVLYLRDEESGAVWSATPAPVRSDTEYVVEHGQGITEFRHEHDGIATRLALGMAGDDAVKLSILHVTNRDARPRRLTLTSYVEWTLGVLREQTQHRVRTRFDATRGAVLADNPFDPQFAPWVAFAALSEPVTDHTGDRREFIGRNGCISSPAALRADTLAARTGLGVDPCAALRCALELAPGETRTVVMLLGAGSDEAEAQRLMDAYRDAGAAEAALARTVRAWEDRLTTVTVRTPDPAFDAIVNRWALTQTLACRMWARSAVYQSGGGYGFRDQLQDVMALAYAEPGIARAHILRAASRQFVEGDVQHWWHPETGRGVRTRFSDDLAWMPYVVDHYVRVTGDTAVLDEYVPFISMRPLEADEHEVYDQPQVSEEHASIYEHCLRALRRACTAGAHGLPLIGTGDWNDGMNRVGKDGRGESVWLAWFLTTVLRAFARIAEHRNDVETAVLLPRAGRCLRAGRGDARLGRRVVPAGLLRRRHAPRLGLQQTECRIDSIAQSWSVISGAGDPVRQTQAMRALEEQLVDADARLIRLLAPPFDKSPRDPGYIKGYLPGVRENGAQYTHAALWAVLAAARRGEPDRAYGWFRMLNPFTHTDTPEGVATYRVEPYVVAADVYTTPGNLGRGGWTWYTGSASWMYRVGLEELVGFRKAGDTLHLEPCVPGDWPELQVDYRFGGATYAIVVERPGLIRARGAEVTMDGRVLPDAAIPLRDDGERHTVRIVPRPA
jgi:cyclic beta-1,2-glucan synthetase